MPKEFAEFESRVGVGPAPAPAGITGPPMQRAVWPRGNRELVRVTNKPIIQFRLGRTDHVLEIAREDVYETDIFQSTLPQPESKWTASFYYSKWVNDLGEFAYNKPGERPLWESSLTTFFPEVEDSPGRSKRKHLKGPRNFLKEIEEVKDILWEVLKPDMDSETANSSMISERIGTLETQNDQDELFAG